MELPPWRINWLRSTWREWNDLLFEGKLTEPRFGLIAKRDRWHDGRFVYRYGKRSKKAFPPPHYLQVHRDNFLDEEELTDTLLHEMVHQYQVEVLEVDTLHDEQFWEILKEKKML